MRHSRGPPTRQQAGMAVNHTFRPPGGARGVHQERVVARHSVVQLARNAIPGRDRRYARPVCLVEERTTVRVDISKAGLRMLQRKRNGITACGKVDHRRPEPACQRAIERDNALPAVWCNNCHAFALRRAMCRQHAAEANRLFLKRLPVDRAARFRKDDRVSPDPGTRFQPVTDRAFRRDLA